MRINAKASLRDEYFKDILEIYAEGLDAQVGGYRINALESQKNNFDFHQGYIKFYDITHKELDATLGRQELKYGKGRLIAAPTWANRIRSFDAAVLHFAPAGSYADVFYAQDVKYDDLDPNRSSDEEFLSGFYGGYAKNKVITLIESYFLTQDIKSGSSDIERYTVGGQLELRVFGNTVCNLEIPYQFGRTGIQYISAYAVHFDIFRQFDASPGKPKFSVEYNLASGDKKRNNNRSNTFYPLYQTTHDPYGIMDFFRWQNMREVAANIVLSLAPNFKLKPQVNFFWLDSTKDNWVNASGTVLRSGTLNSVSSFAGSEVSLRLYYDITKMIKFEAGYAHFFSGAFMSDTGACDDADWAYSQVIFKY